MKRLLAAVGMFLAGGLVSGLAIGALACCFGDPEADMPCAMAGLATMVLVPAFGLVPFVLLAGLALRNRGRREAAWLAFSTGLLFLPAYFALDWPLQKVTGIDPNHRAGVLKWVVPALLAFLGEASVLFGIGWLVTHLMGRGDRSVP